VLQKFNSSGHHQVVDPNTGRRSANGAEYDSQGQARSASPLVTDNKKIPALKGRNTLPAYFGLSGLDLAYSW
jgi:hypothetical protein